MGREKKSAKHEKPKVKKEKAVLGAEKVKKPNIFSKIKIVTFSPLPNATTYRINMQE